MPRVAIRLTLLIALGFATAFAGCGGGEGDSGSALDNALGYLPQDTPLVIAIGTDPEADQVKAAQKIAERFPFGDQAVESLDEGLTREGFDFERDVKPLLGNEFVVGAPDVGAVVGEADDNSFVGAIEAKDAGKLEELVKRDDTKQDGEQNGATLYTDSDGDSFAVEDDVLIVAGTRELLEAALAQRDAEARLSAESFEADTEGIPDDALVRASVDVEQLIAADPDTKDAQKVKWVGALRTLGLALSFSEERATLDFRLATDAEGLTEEDLPIAAGAESPGVIDSADEIGLGLRGPEQILAFAESAGQSVDPAGFGDYSAGKQAIESRLGLSLEKDVFAQLEEGISAAVGLDGTFGVRAAVKDPEAFTETLDKLGKDLADLAEGAAGEPVGYAPPKRGGDFYALATADGESVVYGVVDGAFVLANETERASRLAEDEVKPVEGAEGAIAMSADPERLVVLAVRRLAGGGLGSALGGAAFAEPLDTLTGSMGADTGGLTGRLELTFD